MAIKTVIVTEFLRSTVQVEINVNLNVMTQFEIIKIQTKLFFNFLFCLTRIKFLWRIKSFM